MATGLGRRDLKIKYSVKGVFLNESFLIFLNCLIRNDIAKVGDKLGTIFRSPGSPGSHK